MANNSTGNINILVEKNIPFIKGLLEPFGNVSYPAAGDFTPDVVKDADAIFVRTRTRCDRNLLEGSRCRFIATATIGVDHIDLDYCREHGIEVANAPGCNAPAVAQYVLASVLTLANRPASQYTMGIIGVGHVGRIVEDWARQLDMRVLVNDPPRQAAEGGDNWSTLEDIARECDIITIHTPLDASTRHLIGKDFLDSLKRAPIIINAARGAVVDTPALVDALRKGQVHHAVIDCWEGEPDNISRELLDLCSIATPHIAGYSHEGKVRATRMALDAFSRHFSLPRIEMEENAACGTRSKVKATKILDSYNPLDDTEMLRRDPGSLDSLRNNYNLRHEP